MKTDTAGMIIGQQIKRVFDQMPKGCTIVWFARQINCERANIYRIFKKDNIDILLLSKISKVLKHDFFKDLSENL